MCGNNAYRTEIQAICDKEVIQDPVLCEEVNITATLVRNEEDTRDTFHEIINRYETTPKIFNVRDNINTPLTKISIDEDQELSGTSNEALLMQHHLKFGHISYKRLKQMARIGILPKRLKDARNPFASSNPVPL